MIGRNCELYQFQHWKKNSRICCFNSGEVIHYTVNLKDNQVSQRHCNTFIIALASSRFICSSFNSGVRIIATSSSSQVKEVSCTRWKEIQETVQYHASMSALLKAPTIFRFLNPPMASLPQEFSIGERGDDMIDEDLRQAHRIIKAAVPTGVTPLSKHIMQVKEEVELLAPSLRSQGRRIALILATDGLPSDDRGCSDEGVQQEFTNSLRSLEGLPLWIVVRLCTNDSTVVDYYNELDSQLELSIEVLDDFKSEATEMHATNPWINYTLQIHRMRELGFQHRIFDLLDERKLTISELREYCFLLFGDSNFDGVPEPEVNFKGFLSALDRMMKTEDKQWHPLKKELRSLVSLKKLSDIYGDGACVIM